MSASGRPAYPSWASGWTSLSTLRGFPCRAHFPCGHAAATTPAQRLDVLFALARSRRYRAEHVTIGEGRIVEMPEEDANCLIPCGWIKLAGGSSEEAG